MKKLELNKQTISQLDNDQMAQISGGLFGICLNSCASGTRKGKDCCFNDPNDQEPILIA